MDNTIKNIARCVPETTLGSALSMIKSSHEPVFVFNDNFNNDNNEFLGLVQPYYVLFKKRLPYTTKVKSVIITPPDISDSTPFYKIADFMVATRIYFLPILNDKNEIKEIISAKNMLKEILKKPDIFSQIAQKIKIQKAHTANINSTVKDVYKLLREKGTTRVVLVNDKNKLVGITVRKDIEDAFIKPTDKQRSSSRKGKPINYSFDQERATRFNVPISKFCTRNVLSNKKLLGIENSLKKMIDQEKNSIVLVDKNNFPCGIISIRTILKAMAKFRPKREISIIFKKPLKTTPDYEIEKIYNLIEKFGQKIDKRAPVKEIKINFKKSKNPAGNIILFNIMLLMELFSGKIFVAEVKERKLIIGLAEAVKRIEKQIRRS
ncbi:CBS domain-containing protein [Candidatus Parcubacteria bacterium]|nr:CBS domain-containing protein [Candidatus Parcubacteria bacterium]